MNTRLHAPFERDAFNVDLDLEIEKADEDGTARRLHAVRLLSADVLPPGFMVPGYFPEHISLLVGEGGAFKSTLLVHLACAIAAGASPFGALSAPAPRKVLFLSAEDSLDHLQNRAAAFVAGHGWAEDLIDRNLLALALAEVRLDVAADQARIRAELQHHGATLLCCDPLADLIDGEESSNTDARPATRFLRSLVAEGVASILAHHVTKPAEGKLKVHRVRGASAWLNAARAAYWIESPGDGAITAECIKLSATRRPAPLELQLAVTEDADNEALWLSATVLAPGQGADWRVVDQRELTPSARKALEALAAGETGEALSFSVWQKRAGISDSSLTDALPVLKHQAYVRAEPFGKHAGKPRWAYSITDSGRAALATLGRSSRSESQHRANTGSTPGGVRNSTPDTPLGVPLIPARRDIDLNTEGGVGPGIDPDIPFFDDEEAA